MQLPFTPPTDNLYKFLAITGLIILVLSVVVPRHYEAELESLILDHNRLIQEFNVDYQDMALSFFMSPELMQRVRDEFRVQVPHPISAVTKEERKVVLDGYDEIDDRLKKFSDFIPPNVLRAQALTEENKLAVAKAFSIRQDEYEAFVKRYLTDSVYIDAWRTNATRAVLLRKQSIPLLATIHKVWSLKDRQAEYQQWSQWGMGVGLILTFAGFISWYFRVQRYQDRVLRNEASKKLDA